jgi:uncharacterized protein YdeI (YjbR/CyaY-like superfamily)
VEIGETLEVRDEATFDAWLRANGAAAKDIWVVIYKKSTGKQAVEYGRLVEVALCHGWIDGQIKSIDAERYAQRFSPRRKRSHWTEGNKAIARRLLGEGRMTAAGRAVLSADVIAGEVTEG